jgi:hypothetical protein
MNDLNKDQSPTTVGKHQQPASKTSGTKQTMHALSNTSSPTQMIGTIPLNQLRKDNKASKVKPSALVQRRSLLNDTGTNTPTAIS